MRKYEITDERHPVIRSLRRIRAVRDIPDIGVEAGDLGGWIEHEGNLAQEGTCWVFDEAMVTGLAWVTGSVRVAGAARVFGEEHMLAMTVLASGPFAATLVRTDSGHSLTVECWSGTVPEFRSMILGDNWPEADEETRELRRPELLAFADMCEARIATWKEQADA